VKKHHLPVVQPHKQVTASKTDLFIHCQYPWMPDLQLPVDTGSEAALFGTAFHWLLGGLLAGTYSLKKPIGWDRAVKEAAKKWSVRDAFDLEAHTRVSYQILMAWLRGGNDWGLDFTKNTLQVEKSVALTPKTGETRSCEPVQEEGHIYPDLEPDEIGMSIDLEIDQAAIHPALILDHKSGHDDDFRNPERNPQLLTMASDVTGDPILAIFHAERRGGMPTVHAQEVQRSAVTAHNKKLRKAQLRVGDGSMTPGSWCRYCRAKTICPAARGGIIVSARKMLAGVVEDVTGEAVPVEGMTAMVRRGVENGLTKSSDVGRFHYFRAEMLKLLEMGDREIRVWMKDHPKKSPKRPDGKRLVWGSRTVERLSKERIITALGTTDAEKLFRKLRRLGALEAKEEEFLRAVWDD